MKKTNTTELQTGNLQHLHKGLVCPPPVITRPGESSCKIMISKNKLQHQNLETFKSNWKTSITHTHKHTLTQLIKTIFSPMQHDPQLID